MRSPSATPVSRADAVPLRRRREALQQAGRGQEIPVRVLGVDAALDGVAAGAVLRQGHPAEVVAPREPELESDQVEAGDHLRHRMLDLDARVHLEKVVRPVGGQDELHRAGAAVALPLDQGECCGRSCARAGPRPPRVTAPPRRSSESAAAPSTPAPSGGSRARRRGRRPGSRCGAAGARASPGRRCRRRRRARPWSGWRPRPRRASPARRRGACRCRRRRQTPSPAAGSPPAPRHLVEAGAVVRREPGAAGDDGEAPRPARWCARAPCRPWRRCSPPSGRPRRGPRPPPPARTPAFSARKP